MKFFNNEAEEEFVKDKFSFLLDRGYEYSYECVLYEIHVHKFSRPDGNLIQLNDDFREHFVNLRILKKEKTTVVDFSYGTNVWTMDWVGMKAALEETKALREKYVKDRSFSHSKYSRAVYDVFVKLIQENLDTLED